MNNAQIFAYQQARDACPKVWAATTWFQGEFSVDGYYDTEEAAQMHVDWLNSRKPRVGKAAVAAYPVVTKAVAALRFTPPAGEKQ
jgi:hypothetical protein